MTTAAVGARTGVASLAEPAGPVRWSPPRRRRRVPVAWPLAALLLGYPLWWALGVAPLVWTIFAIPMTVQLYRRRPVRLPPMFWVWGLFLGLVAISVTMLNVTAPATIPVSSAGGNYVAYGIRLLNYLSVTVILVYIGNLTERELPRLRLVRWLGWVFVVTVVGGLAGTFFPHFGYDSPIKRFVPASLQGIDFVKQLTQSVTVAQDQEAPRLAATQRAVRVRQRLGQQLRDPALLVRAWAFPRGSPTDGHDGGPRRSARHLGDPRDLLPEARQCGSGWVSPSLYIIVLLRPASGGYPRRARGAGLRTVLVGSVDLRDPSAQQRHRAPHLRNTAQQRDPGPRWPVRHVAASLHSPLVGYGSDAGKTIGSEQARPPRGRRRTAHGAATG